MIFSRNFSKKEIIDLVKYELSKLGLSLNKEKITLITKMSRQGVIGIVVNKKLQVNIKYRKNIRKEIFFIKKYGLISHLEHINSSISKEKYLNQLLGKINFVIQVDNTNKEFIDYKKYILELIKNNR